ncbi:hypothetical protein FKM82_012990 [Ascaphus truei]
MSLLTQTTTSTGEKTATFERSCAEAAHCDKPGRMSSFSISTGTNSTCCATDSCAPATPTLPAEEALENGVRCRACFTHNVSLCPNNTVIKCKGTETFCAEYVVKSDAESAIIWGCSSESFCHSANRSQNLVNGKGTTVSARCVRSGSRLQRSPSLPLLAALLLGTRGL